MNDSYYSSYLFVAIFFAVALIFPVLPLILAKFIAPKKPSPIKQATYECGVEAKGDAWIQLRKSNTEPIVRIFAEAREKEKSVGLCERAAGLLR